MPLEGFLEVLGALLGCLGAVLGRLVAVLGRLGAVLGASWNRLGGSLGCHDRQLGLWGVVVLTGWIVQDRLRYRAGGFGGSLLDQIQLKIRSKSES